MTTSTDTTDEPTTPTGDEPAATSDTRKPKKKKISEKHATKHATMIACNSTARNLFSESDEIRKLNEKIQHLQAELQHQRELIYCYNLMQ